MAARFNEIVIDAHDPHRLAGFWAEVLGYRVLHREEDEVEIGAAPVDAAALRAGPVAPTLVFVTVPDAKVAKNRVHVDVTPVDRSRAEEVERLLALGARHVDVGQGDAPWTVLADPEGNEFCVLRSPEERSAG